MSDTTGSRQKAIPLLLSSSPHIASPVNSTALMRNMLIALAPVSIFSVVIFGLPALLNIIVAAASAIGGEALFRLAIRQPLRVKDLSAGVTGVLLALVIPPSMPLWMTALGAVFAVVVAKEFFGGLGANVFNPALAGRAFLVMSFPASMTTWHNPQNDFALALTDATSGPSLLGMARAGGGLNAPYWQTAKEMFLGYRAGSAGETSVLLILAAFVFLLVTKTIDWRAPVSMLAAAFIAFFVLGFDPLIAILSGGLIFGAVYMTTDYVTVPLMPWGKIIFGVGAGIITALIRKWGSYPEGVCYSILIMNCAVPFLNRILPRKYGYVPKKKGDK
ncbi:MAG: RnfABCDGE type electron transport complex subunit D [Treponema sp.]|jgi:electron transport complex protein RnfD|nr:RnfABCDGE type electron transport complex subunit D [Treponema sp.]